MCWVVRELFGICRTLFRLQPFVEHLKFCGVHFHGIRGMQCTCCVVHSCWLHCFLWSQWMFGCWSWLHSGCCSNPDCLRNSTDLPWCWHVVNMFCCPATLTRLNSLWGSGVALSSVGQNYRACGENNGLTAKQTFPNSVRSCSVFIFSHYKRQ